MNSPFFRLYDLDWRELHFPRPIDTAGAVERLHALACDPHAPLVVLEVRGSAKQVRILLGTETSATKRVVQHLGAVAVELTGPRRPAITARKLAISNRQRPLNSEVLEVSAKAILSALAACGDGEELTLQVVLGPRLSAFVVPGNVRQPVPLHRVLIEGFGSGSPLDTEARTALVKKVAEPGFAATVRIGVSAATPQRRQALALGLLGALKRLEVPGVYLSLSDEKPERLGAGTTVAAPRRWPLRLNVREVAAVAALPVGDDELSGLPPLHPKPLPPVAISKADDRDHIVVAQTTAPGIDANLSLSRDALLRHLHIIGPTGVGKSWLLANLALKQIDQGMGVVMIEPKGDLVDDVLARIPEHRKSDVVVLDPNAEQVVGLNPLASTNAAESAPELRADAVLSVFTHLFGKSLGPRSTDILHSCLLTLARRSNATLTDIPRLLSDQTFRRQCLPAVMSDPTLASFWSWYESLSIDGQANVVAPLMNKLRAVLLRPSVRAVLDQPKPKFDVAEVFTKKRILLVPLPVATLGQEGSALLGSLVVSALWRAVQARTTLPASRRTPVSIILDEAQQFLRLPTDLGEALAMSRGYGVGWTLAHQYLDQMPKDLRSSVLANCRSRVAFQLSRDDAKVMASGATGRPEQRPASDDFTALPAFHVYASLFEAGAVQPYVSGRTLPLSKATTDPRTLRSQSAEAYGYRSEPVPEPPTARPIARPVASSSDPVNPLVGASDQPESASTPLYQPEPHVGRRRRAEP